METDRVLLADAAKAAGMKCMGWYVGETFGMYTGDGDSGVYTRWNPLTDDGDALRLLAKLPSLWTLELRFGVPTIELHVAWGTGVGIQIAEHAGEAHDRASVIRRAIVRAVAAIAAMPAVGAA